jgi:hypothetical protein
MLLHGEKCQESSLSSLFSGGGSDKTKRVVLKRKQQRQFVPAK